VGGPGQDAPPGVVFEDEDLLVVNKPAGWNTHAPSPYSGEGLYEWLKHREPRWAHLAIVHRLDKETSGLIVLAKSPRANQSLTHQFVSQAVRKRYVLITDRPVNQPEFNVKSFLKRLGDRYLSCPSATGGQRAETSFRVIAQKDRRTRIAARPLTGRTHQIRAQAAASGFPVLGDTLYDGTAAARLYLHAQEIALQHPGTGDNLKFEAPPQFDEPREQALRRAIIQPEYTNVFRQIHGAADGWPGWYLDRLGEAWLSQSSGELSVAQGDYLDRIRAADPSGPVYHKRLDRLVRHTGPADASPVCIRGSAGDRTVLVRENGLRFELRFSEGYSVGLFLDQRDNRRRLLRAYIASGFPPPSPRDYQPSLLNTFAYTCGFSVCAASAGIRTVNLDLSSKYLDWGQRNFALNGLPTAGHEFFQGDVFDWLNRLAKKGRRFDYIVLDPPTFSTSKKSGVFRVEKDYERLFKAALAVLGPEGIVLACANSATLKPEAFLDLLQRTISQSNCILRAGHYVPQPPDFPVHRSEPAYLKTVWLSIQSRSGHSGSGR
jgi:23S rRNA (cytosine1962-C5)-methyltransferase